MSTQRKSNIELLRLVAMFMILVGHAATHGFDIPSLPLHTNSLINVALSQGARIAVDIFVLITGYFSTSTDIKWAKIFTFHRQVWFYSVSIFLILFIFTDIRFGTKQIFTVLFPAYFSLYWFATSYIILLFLSPYLNILIENLEEKRHRQLLIILIIIFSILPTFIPVFPFNNLIWFIALYLIGSYMRKYDNHIMNSVKLWHGFGLFGLIMGLAVSAFYFGYNIPYFRHNAIYLFAEPSKITALACAILLFLGFRNIKMGYIKWINLLGGSAFAVYLITDNRFIRHYVFNPISSNVENIQGGGYIFLYLGWCLIVFICCLLVDILRNLIGKSLNTLIKLNNGKKANKSNPMD